MKLTNSFDLTLIFNNYHLQRTLKMDSINLSQRVSSLPKFSPEWTLSKMELKMVTDELEFLYNESMGRG